MKTKPITLILTLLFCLSGSVFAEEKVSESSKLRFKKNKNRVHRFREHKILEINKTDYKDIDELVKRISSWKSKKIDLGKIWAYEDIKEALKKTKSVNDISISLPYSYTSFKFKPVRKYKNLILISHIHSRFKSAPRLDLLVHNNEIKFKIGKDYFCYFPTRGISVSYSHKSKTGVDLLIRKNLYVYGSPIAEAEYNKQFNTAKDEN